MIRGVVLDMDGTLCDTEVVWRDVAFEVAAELGVDLPLETYLAIVGLPGPVGRVRFGELAAAGFPVEQWFTLTEERALAACLLGVPLKPGVHELLDLLEQQGIPAAVCTSSTYSGVERHLGGTDVLDRVAGVVAQGDYVLGKPSAEPYLKAAALLGVESSLCLARIHRREPLSGSFSMRSIQCLRPARMPACGPPSSLSPLKSTRSAPAATLARAIGSPAKPKRLKSSKAPLPISSMTGS